MLFRNLILQFFFILFFTTCSTFIKSCKLLNAKSYENKKILIATFLNACKVTLAK